MEELSPLNTGIRKFIRSTMRLISRGVRNTSFRLLYMVGMAVFLLATTVIWSILGAQVQFQNADQLSDPYLFESWATFHGATFPAAHTFFLKWPIFWLLHVVGITTTSLTVATVVVATLTVLVLMVILARIVRRPLLLGTLYAALSLVLLLVPAQAYSGGLLPVNMAMLTTRNIEYAVYLIAIIVYIGAVRLRSWAYVWATLLLTCLFASDKLFLALSIGGAAIALVVYALLNNWRMVAFSVRWLVGGIAAAVLATMLLLAIQAAGITHFSSGSGVNPYGSSTGIKELITGSVYAVLGVFTNFGANPVYDGRVIVQLPHQLIANFTTARMLLSIVALLLVVQVGWLVWRLLRPTLHRTSTDTGVHMPLASQLSVALLCSTVVACGVYVATNHYYAVDARYLAIALFAGVIAAATALRRHHWSKPKWLVLAGCTLVLASVFAANVARTTADTQAAAYDQLSQRNHSIVQALNHYAVDVLVGDYWRVLPIKSVSQGELTVTPMADCTTPAAALSSTAWQPDLGHHRFAYLLTLDGSLTNYPKCNLAQITQAYGRPNAVQVIAGTAAQPKEAILFYDAGSHPLTVSVPSQSAVSLLPINLDQLTKTNCMQSTVMNVVAHEDDDLLFLSPDLLHELDAEKCVRTVFLTAGDGGFDKFYWLSRQQGAEAAYSVMLGIPNVWDQQTLALGGGRYATVATPRESKRVSLIFLNLPDGNIQGQGFDDSDHESLARLRSGDISLIHAVDRQSSYTADQLTQTLAQLMAVYQPAMIQTQADVTSDTFPDHSDHIATSQFATAAAALYSQQHFGGVIAIPVSRYIGYPIHSYDSNVTGADLARKEAAFFAYAQHDGGVCNSVAQCAEVPTYDAYLSRQYQQ
jgi:LmbE family N-acetylglucosaminyl deacetylase